MVLTVLHNQNGEDLLLFCSCFLLDLVRPHKIQKEEILNVNSQNKYSVVVLKRHSQKTQKDCSNRGGELDSFH